MNDIGTRRVSVPLDRTELHALIAISEEECRPVGEQLRYWLRLEAGRRGLLKTEDVLQAPLKGATKGQGDANS